TRFAFTGLRGDVGKLEQLAARVRPAAGFGDRSALSIRGVERVESTVGIRLKDPGIAGEMLFGMDAGTIRRVEKHCGGRRLAVERAVVANIGPNPSGPGLDLG